MLKTSALKSLRRPIYVINSADRTNILYSPTDACAAPQFLSKLTPLFVQYVYCLPFSLMTTMVTMMWASLDMVTLDSLQVFKDQSLIQIWSAFLFTLYHAASLIVLLNMLIAMMSNSYQRVEVFKPLLVECIE